jgi:hypothetical protein
MRHRKVGIHVNGLSALLYRFVILMRNEKFFRNIGADNNG